MNLKDLKDHEKAAIIILSLENEEEGLGAAILREIPKEKVAKIASAMSRLGRVSKEVTESVMTEFLNGFDDENSSISSDETTTLNLLRKSLGRDSEIVKQFESNANYRLKILDEFDDDYLFEVIKNENDSFIVLILAYISPKRASNLIKKFEGSKRVGLLIGVSKLTDVDAATVDIVADFLDQALKEQKSKVKLTQSGSKYVAEVLSNMGTEEANKLLEEIEDTNPDLAEKISNNMFNFSHVFTLFKDDLISLVRSFDLKDWAKALKGLEQSKIELVLGSMSKGNSENLLDELNLMTPIRKSEQEDIRSKITDYAREKILKEEYRSPGTEDEWV